MRDFAEQIWPALGDEVHNLVVLEHADSTHAMALRLIEQMDEEGLELAPTLLVAGRQLSGQGRGERTWTSPQGGLYLSWISSQIEQPTLIQLPMLAAAAAHTAVTGLGLKKLGIKWPNDLLVGGHKIGGILIHARQGEPLWATVGLGVNLTQTPILDQVEGLPATSLADHLEGADWNDWATQIAQKFVVALQCSLRTPDDALECWRSNLLHHSGDAMTVRLASGAVQQGTFAGLTEEGFLRLETTDGETVISSGDVVEKD